MLRTGMFVDFKFDSPFASMLLFCTDAPLLYWCSPFVLMLGFQWFGRNRSYHIVLLVLLFMTQPHYRIEISESTVVPMNASHCHVIKWRCYHVTRYRPRHQWRTHRVPDVVVVDAAAQLGVLALAIDDDLVSVPTHAVLHLRETALFGRIRPLTSRHAGGRLEVVVHSVRTRRRCNDEWRCNFVKCNSHSCVDVDSFITEATSFDIGLITVAWLISFYGRLCKHYSS